jgi:hypothetical protein
MHRLIFCAGVAVFASALCFAAGEVVNAVHGTITKVDSTAKTVVVKGTDGTEHTVRVVAKTSVQGTEAGAKDTFHGLKEGTEVVAHYTTKGTDKTAVEIDKVGKDGIKAVEGTVSTVDRGGKKLVVKSADGAEQAFKLTDHAAVDAAKDVQKGAEKSAKVTVYYTESAGKKVAHFFERH